MQRSKNNDQAQLQALASEFAWLDIPSALFCLQVVTEASTVSSSGFSDGLTACPAAQCAGDHTVQKAFFVRKNVATIDRKAMTSGITDFKTVRAAQIVATVCLSFKNLLCVHANESVYACATGQRNISFGVSTQTRSLLLSSNKYLRCYHNVKLRIN